MFGLNKTDLATIQEVFSRYEEIKEAVIFGSRAKGTQRPGSDVDVALKGSGGNLVATAVGAILNEESCLPYFFDIIDYQSIDNEALIEHINRVGKVIYRKDS